MTALYFVTIVSLMISAIFDKGKTKEALRVTWKKLKNILPEYMKLLILLSFILLIPDHIIIKYLGETSPVIGLLFGLIFGSITMMPGFIAYPLSGILVSKGVSYMIVAAFVTTLMMVGVVTYPVERQYFGVRATIIRNITSLLIAVIIAIAMGIFYGEVF